MFFFDFSFDVGVFDAHTSDRSWWCDTASAPSVLRKQRRMLSGFFWWGGRKSRPSVGRGGTCRFFLVLSCRMPLLTDREARICVCCRAAHLGFCWSGEGSLVCLFCCLPLLLSASPAACLSCYLPLLLSASPAACPSCCEPLLLLTPPGSGGIAPPPAFPPAGPPAPRGGCVTRRRRTCRAGRRGG